MENITIEKIIKFDSVIDSIESFDVEDNLRYDLLEDNTHATSSLSLSGSVNTLTGKKEFKEEVDVDIYAPFEKQIDKDSFKINVKDYSYMVNHKNLIVYLILSIDGIVDFQNDSNDENTNIVEEINTLNEINEDKTLVRETNEDAKIYEEPLKVEEVNENNIEKEPMVKIKEAEDKEQITSSWASDVFKLTDNYVIFKRFKIKNCEKHD